jgi:RNA-binding protein 25
MVKYLGELEDDDVVMFVIEHLKDHKSPAKLVEGLEPVRTIQTSQTLLNPCDLVGS